MVQRAADAYFGDVEQCSFSPSMGMKEQPGRPMRDTLLNELRSRSLLLVLDNCEHLVEASAALAADLLRTCRAVRILATSRQPLRIAGERVWLVPPLAAPDVSSSDGADVVAHNPAVQLFVERAREVRDSFGVTAESSRPIAAICGRLDGLPLAIELAAARVRVLTPDQILARLGDVFGLLVGGSRAAPRRQQTLRATLDWSFSLLDLDARRRFARLAVFAGGFDLESVHAVWSDEGQGDRTVLEALTDLVDHSLVTAQPQGGAMRYRLLEPVRQYAQERLHQDNLWEPTRRRHTDYFLTLAERAKTGFQTAELGLWDARLKLEHDNMRAALRRCLDAGEAETALRLAAALHWSLWRHAGNRNEGRRWLEESLALAADAPAAVRASALHAAADLANVTGDYGDARARGEQAAVLWRRLGDRGGLGETLINLGRIVARTARTRDDYEQGKAMLDEAIALSRDSGNLWNAGLAMLVLGWTLWEGGELDRAASILAEDEALLRQIGECHLHGHVVALQGGVARDRGDLVSAEQLIERGLAETRAIDCDHGMAEALYLLAGLTRSRAEYRRATNQVMESLVLYHHLTNPAQVADRIELLGALACDQGQPEHAATLFAAAATLHELAGVSTPPILQPGYERDLASARAHLGSRRFGAAWTRGARMHVDDVVAYARQLAIASASERE